MNGRIKELRKSLNKSQEEFGKYLGLSKSGVSEIEAGRRSVTEQHIIMLKNSGLNVNEDWLRYGEGEMFVELSRKDKIMAWATEALSSESEDYKKRFVDALDALSVDDWEVLANMAETMANRNKKKKD